MPTQILLYYKYTQITDPEGLRKQQQELCEQLELTGRIIIAAEGINGTVQGNVEQTEEYIRSLQTVPAFQDIDFKKSQSEVAAFPKLSIKVRTEIVSAQLGGADINPARITGKYLLPSELHEWFQNGEEFYIVDMRNDYEHKVGYFENSILAPFGNFRDLPKALPALESLRDKTILTVCTGGVRCEKASGYLVNNGFNDVYQLYGGIVSYMEKYPNQNFLGKLYVFDGRVTMGFNIDAPDHLIVGKCAKCDSASDHYTDCNYIHCKGVRHFICCDNCMETGKGYCSEDCSKADAKLQSELAQV